MPSRTMNAPRALGVGGNVLVVILCANWTRGRMRCIKRGLWMSGCIYLMLMYGM